LLFIHHLWDLLFTDQAIARPIEVHFNGEANPMTLLLLGNNTLWVLHLYPQSVILLVNSLVKPLGT
jgi:hypothetical protein